MFEAQNGTVEVPVTVDVWLGPTRRTLTSTYGQTSMYDMTLNGQPREIDTFELFVFEDDRFGNWEPVPYPGTNFVRVSADRHTLSISPPSVKETYEIQYDAHDATECSSFGTIDLDVTGP